MPSGVVGVPNQDTWDAAVHARGHEEGHPILDFGGLDVGNCSVASDRYRQRKQHDDTTESQTV